MMLIEQPHLCTTDAVGRSTQPFSVQLNRLTIKSYAAALLVDTDQAPSAAFMPWSARKPMALRVSTVAEPICGSSTTFSSSR